MLRVAFFETVSLVGSYDVWKTNSALAMGLWRGGMVGKMAKEIFVVDRRW